MGSFDTKKSKHNGRQNDACYDENELGGFSHVSSLLLELLSLMQPDKSDFIEVLNSSQN